MHNKMKSVALLTFILPALGGCQSIGHFFGFRKHENSAQLAISKNYYEEQLALGRRHLDDGQYGLAIVDFSNARQAPEQAAGAYNGMAIAYLQLGRPDLAERFFQQAIASDPGDRRYQANLAQFYASVAEADVRKTPIELPMPALAEANAESTAGMSTERNSSRNVAVVVPKLNNRITRVSEQEVMIGTLAGQSSEAAGRRQALNVTSTRPPERRLNPQYPSRVIIGSSHVVGPPEDVMYPARIRITQTDIANASQK